uniref:ATP synthase F0 subunit 8 n=1 Tax=Coquillettidia nigricans TaxID=1257098 RepID=UPI001EE052C7|nr:ATP synthase F0 subunit 8 [Coquillettidia nigricans]UIS24527.1 ATP synthase subunit 8 [Coquillettidia nigricans]
MPQMAPISWLIMFIIFSITMVIFNIKNYYCFFYNSSKIMNSNITYKTKIMNWQW